MFLSRSFHVVQTTDVSHFLYFNTLYFNNVAVRDDSADFIDYVDRVNYVDYAKNFQFRPIFPVATPAFLPFVSVASSFLLAPSPDVIPLSFCRFFLFFHAERRLPPSLRKYFDHRQ